MNRISTFREETFPIFSFRSLWLLICTEVQVRVRVVGGVGGGGATAKEQVVVFGQK